ncbi:MAG: OmpP1/FadL family transporter [Mangrovibacterium sp.]
MKTRIILLLMLLSMNFGAFSQNLVDAFRLSDVKMQGTARATAMGNAFGALGGDFTSASINPAGVGLYMKGEFQATMQLGNYKHEANYLGVKTLETSNPFSIPSLSYVVPFKTNASANSSLVSVSLGFGYNRMNNFNTSTIVNGFNATSSMLDQFTQNATDGYLGTYYEELAINADAIYADDLGTFYHDLQKYQDGLPSENYAHDQQKIIDHSGSVDEYAFTAAFNFNHKIYFGATLGIHDVSFEEVSLMIENNPDYNGDNDFDHFYESQFEQYLETTGTGVNAKFGLIYKPIEALRLGVAVHTPTYYELHDYYDSFMSYEYDQYKAGEFEPKYNEAIPSNAGEYDYKIHTPMKAVFSAAYVIGKRAILSADYEYVDYAKMKLKRGGGGYTFSDENREIKSVFKSVGNLHVGAEFRLTDQFSLRGGYENSPSPYELEGWQSTLNTYSLGFGYRFGACYLDFAYKHSANTSNLELYEMPYGVVNTGYDDVVTSSIAEIDYKRNYYTLTFGIRF